MFSIFFAFPVSSPNSIYTPSPLNITSPSSLTSNLVGSLVVILLITSSKTTPKTES